MSLPGQWDAVHGEVYVLYWGGRPFRHRCTMTTSLNVTHALTHWRRFWLSVRCEQTCCRFFETSSIGCNLIFLRAHLQVNILNYTDNTVTVRYWMRVLIDGIIFCGWPSRWVLIAPSGVITCHKLQTKTTCLVQCTSMTTMLNYSAAAVIQQELCV